MATSDNYYRVFDGETGDKRSTDIDTDAFVISGKSHRSRLWLVLSGTIAKTDPDPTVGPRIAVILVDVFGNTGDESKYVTSITDLRQMEAVELPPNQKAIFAIENSNSGENVTLDVYRVNL